MKKIQTPKIGLRTIKTAIAVFLCLALIPNEPFFACLTSVFCIQDSIKQSVKVAKDRIYGTLWGAANGLIIMSIFKYLTLNLENDFIRKFIIYTLIALGIIIVIHTNITYLKLPGAVNTACISFLAITTAHAFSDPYNYAFIRAVETFLGLIIGLLVNQIIIPPKNHHT